jgi:hypothetical protein
MRKESPDTARLNQLILLEEFRYWDALRNGVSQNVLESIRERIKTLKAGSIKENSRRTVFNTNNDNNRLHSP